MIPTKVIETKRPKMNVETESRPRENIIVNLKSVTGYGNGLIFEHDSESENSKKYFELHRYAYNMQTTWIQSDCRGGNIL